MKLILIFLIVWIPLSSSHAVSICGSIDVARTSNINLENFIFASDLEKNTRIDRIQCGLPGEELKICSSCSERTPENLYSKIRPIIGSKEHLNWHLVWHQLRGFPHELTEDRFLKLKKSGWIPEKLSLKQFLKRHAQRGELAGEDFLYMHRLMIKMVQLDSAAQGVPCMAPWLELPNSIHDQLWPVPKKFPNADSIMKAEIELSNLKVQLSKLKKIELLKKISLSQFGTMIESGIHQSLHNFYRSNPLCSPEAKAQNLGCDDLLPNETSPMNKYFWKIHGLVDSLIGDWLAANSYDSISIDCNGDNHCYTWKGTWIGVVPKNL